MKQNVFFLFVAILFLSQITDASAENFEDVDLYILGSSDDGFLNFELPSGGTTQTAVIAENETTKGPTFNEVGRWNTGTLSTQSNISGDWSGNAWVYSNRAVTVTLRYTLLQDGETLDSFEFSGNIDADARVELTSGEQDFSLTEIATSPLTILIESSWNDQPGTPPTTDIVINLEYGSSTENTHIQIPISHVQIKKGQEPYVNEGGKEVTVYVHVFDVFGVDDVLSLIKNSYSMQMGPDQGVEAGTLWSANVTRTANKNNDYVEVQLVWFYGGHSLPPETNSYSLEFEAVDSLSDASWSQTLTVDLYITPEADIEISIGSTKKTVDFGNIANYQLTFTNTGSGAGDFIVDDENADGWEVNISAYEFALDVGESRSVTVSVTVPLVTSDGQKSFTVITVREVSDSDIRDSVNLQTVAKEPAPNWDFTIEIDFLANENYDEETAYLIVKDRQAIDILFDITNEGNEENNYNLEAISQDSAFTFSFNPSFVSLSSGESSEVLLSLTPKDDYFGTSTYIEIIAKSAGDGKEESETIAIEFRQSGSIDLRDSNLQIKVSEGSSGSHLLQISNSDSEEAKRIYLLVSGIEPSDQLVEGWISFEDKNGKEISSISYLTILPSQIVEITMVISIPNGADIGSYDFQISMHNEQQLRISNSYQFRVVALEASGSEDTNLSLYVVLLFILGVVGFGIYRNFSGGDYEDYDDYDDFDDLEDMPEFFEEPAPAIPPEYATPEALIQEEVVPLEAVTASIPSPEVEVQSKPRKKWFGLFGSSEDDSVVSEPMLAEQAVAQPVSAEPVAVQPVSAEPVVAQPVSAEPVVAQPVSAEPVVAQAVIVPDEENE